MATDDTYFEFTSPDSEATFEVVSFKGHEALGKTFRFVLELFCLEELNFKKLRGKTANFYLTVKGRKREIHGVIGQVKIRNPLEEGYLYQLTLIPRLERLSLIQTNEVYLDQQLPNTLSQILEEGELASDDYDLSELGSYRDWEFRCQFGESHLNFLQRICEREGIYYCFKHEDEKDKIIFHDNLFSHLDDPEIELNYQPGTGLEDNSELGLLLLWTSQGEPLPRKITLKDYSSNSPSVNIEAEATIDDEGFGHIYRYCDNLVDLDEAEQIAEVRAQEIAMQGEIFQGESCEVTLEPGKAFHVLGHFRAQDNGDFYAFSIEHEGYNPDFDRLGANNQQLPYRNRLKALRTEVQYRPAQTTEKPKFHGVLNAIIDAEDDGQYANIDDEGRYKVVLPFDRIHAPGECQASCWIPMMQPSAGTGGGMHFPLLQGTEVLLSFIGGDPDRPVISGALPNASSPSHINRNNRTCNEIHSASGNRIEMEDEVGKSRLKLFSPTNSTYMHLGAPNDSGDGYTISTHGLYRTEVLGGWQTLTYAKNYPIDGQSIESFERDEDSESIDKDKVNEQEVFTFPKFQQESPGQLDDDSELNRENELSGAYIINRRAGPLYAWQIGPTYSFWSPDSPVYEFGNREINRYADHPSEDPDSWDVPDCSGVAWEPGNNHVEKTWADHFQYQKGNTLQWKEESSGVYKMGRCYTEYHPGNTEPKLNDSGENDLSAAYGNNQKFKTSKIMGGQYEYTEGEKVEVVNGNKLMHYHGLYSSTMHGASIETYKEPSTVTYHDSHTVTHLGNNAHIDMGEFMGISGSANFGINLGTCLTLNLAANTTINIDVDFKGKLAGSIELSTGVALELNFAKKFKYQKMDDYDIKKKRAEAREAKKEATSKEVTVTRKRSNAVIKQNSKFLKELKSNKLFKQQAAKHLFN